MRLYSDPAHPLAPALPFDGQGLPLKRDRLGRQGRAEGPVVLALLGAEAGQGADAGPGNLIMDGGTATMDELIEGIERGVLVTRFWYIRSLDPQTLLVTGPDPRRAVPDREGEGHAAR